MPHRASTHLANRSSVGWFLAIGVLAGLVHYVITLSLHELASVRPAMANGAGFLCAFPVSYCGHRTLSFAGTAIPHGRALPRLFAVAGLAFIANQTLLLSLLRFTTLPLWIALGLVLAAVAFATYLLSRSWVFGPRSAT